MKKKTTQRKTKFTKQALRLQRELFFSVLAIILTVLLFIRFHSAPQVYKVVVYQEDQSEELIQYYNDFKTAQKEMQKQIDAGKFNPAVLDGDDKILAIKYGVVNFNTKTCGENTSYTLEINKKNGYTNGCYGADGAYLQTSEDGKQVRFKQSGVVGWVAMQDVEIYNYSNNTAVASQNYYSIEDGDIVHKGTTDISSPDYAINIEIGESIPQLTKDIYYSYDAHYFYETYERMIDDYRKHTYEQSVNKDEPYYNYYQYVSHRAKSAYVSKDINWYITNYLGFTSKPTAFPPMNTQSQLYDEGYSFVDAQNTYGANAIMMFALAINESGMGKSEISITKNNLFGHAAYDNAPAENAEGYDSVASSIKTHASIFLNQGYLNPCDQAKEDDNPSPSTCLNLTGNRYAGGFFGDKGSGMNVNYASDPYWGEKAALYYRTFDEINENKDKDRYDVKVLKARINMNAYAAPDENANVIYITPTYENYAVTVIGEVKGTEVEGNTTWYKIQSDAVINTRRNGSAVAPETYSYKNDIIYLPAAYFK